MRTQGVPKQNPCEDELLHHGGEPTPFETCSKHMWKVRANWSRELLTRDFFLEWIPVAKTNRSEIYSVE